ncbi:Helix-turn-helix [Selenomonas ruminantium]|uniref:Helix-turn-helix n=1 Tax=Selenomonas ruminantium TaxID=971 RepID=A0A1M6VKD9_SELRU|nr:helix-turn-helix transcriptional regulator [Selenomonas ruminantium]SHK81824.1 Helix-turn-helix [Selenomonas ruminantium]
MSLKDNLKKCRESTGYTAKQFATLAGIPYQTYVNYETKGTWTSEENLYKIAETLNVSFDVLLGRKIDWFKYYVKKFNVDGIGTIKEGKHGKVLVTLNILDSPPFAPAVIMTREEFVELCKGAEKEPRNFHNDIKPPFINLYARGCYERNQSPVLMPPEIPEFEEVEYNPNEDIDYEAFEVQPK